MTYSLALGMIGFALQIEAPPGSLERLTEACVPPAIRARSFESLSEAQRREILVCATRQTAEIVNAQLPHQVDSMTTLQSVEAIGPLLVYNSRVAVDAAAVTPVQRQTLEQQTRRFVCAQTQMRQTIARGGAYRYVWQDRNGAQIHRLTIDAC